MASRSPTPVRPSVFQSFSICSPHPISSRRNRTPPGAHPRAAVAAGPELLLELTELRASYKRDGATWQSNYAELKAHYETYYETYTAADAAAGHAEQLAVAPAGNSEGWRRAGGGRVEDEARSDRSLCIATLLTCNSYACLADYRPGSTTPARRSPSHSQMRRSRLPPRPRPRGGWRTSWRTLGADYAASAPRLTKRAGESARKNRWL